MLRDLAQVVSAALPRQDRAAACRAVRGERGGVRALGGLSRVLVEVFRFMKVLRQGRLNAPFIAACLLNIFRFPASIAAFEDRYVGIRGGDSKCRGLEEIE